MPYMKFTKDSQSYEIDLDIMSRFRELQEAVSLIQSELGHDSTAIATAMAEYDSHVAELSSYEEAMQAEYLSSLQEEMMALNINVPSTLESNGLQEKIDYYEQLIAKAREESMDGEG